MIINGANDPYWTIDALNFCWDDLKTDMWVLYVPNGAQPRAGTRRRQEGSRPSPENVGGVRPPSGQGKPDAAPGVEPRRGQGRMRLTVRPTRCRARRGFGLPSRRHAISASPNGSRAKQPSSAMTPSSAPSPRPRTASWRSSESSTMRSMASAISFPPRFASLARIESRGGLSRSTCT
jgi:hypothetical protein